MATAIARPSDSFTYATPRAFGGKRVMRLGLAANYGIDETGVKKAMERGVNVFAWTARGSGLRNPLREALAKKREDVSVIGFSTLGFFGWRVRGSAESLLKSLKTDYLDVLLLGWVGVAASWTSATERELRALRESGKVKAIGMSIHDRPRAGKIAESGAVDLLMIRYNAAHPGAEREIFPHVKDKSPSILAYTATSWRKLLKRPRGWEGNVMTAGDCYRFQLSSPHVDLALSGPANWEQMNENLNALDRGPLDADEDKWVRDFGRAVHG